MLLQCCERTKRKLFTKTKTEIRIVRGEPKSKRMSFQYNNFYNPGRHSEICLSGRKLFARNSGPEIVT